jgi:2-polyprenyl-3-methyl-5-hydroxy-6-metoxy-1,4-benzoquinol methylase
MTAEADYDAWHASLGPDIGANDPWHQMVANHVDVSRDYNVGSLLEIGCGRGGFSCWLAKQPVRPKEIIAADFSGTAVKTGSMASKKLGIEGVRWLHADIQDIPLPDNSVDTVVSFETVEHVPDPSLAIKEMARVLKPGGRLFLTTPNYFGGFGLYRLYLPLTGRNFTECGQPINNWMFTPKTISWVKVAGLKVEKVDGVGHYFLFPRCLPKRIHLLDRFRWLTKWTGHHSMVQAVK